VNEVSKIKLAVIMSALNEERTIGDVIDGIPRKMGVPAQVLVIVVDDGSTDRTGYIAREKGAVVIRHERRLGLGRSFTEGLDRALQEGADVVVNIDADGQFNPQDIPALIAPILQGRADLVTASRFANKELTPRMSWIKKWGNRAMSRLVNFVTGVTALTDVSCGFRAYSLEAALQIRLSGHFTHVQETIIDLVNKGMRVVEVPLRIKGAREHGDSRVAKSIPRYALRAGGIVMRTLCRSRPLFFFGLIGGTVLGLGVMQGLIAAAYWCLKGEAMPVWSLLFSSSLFITTGFLTLVLALVADMVKRVIEVSERVLFLAKFNEYRARKQDRARTAAQPRSSAGALSDHAE